MFGIAASKRHPRPQIKEENPGDVKKGVTNRYPVRCSYKHITICENTNYYLLVTTWIGPGVKE